MAVGLLLGVAGTLAAGDAPAEQRHFDQRIRPILEKYCYSCHGPEKRKGDLDLAVFTTLSSAQEHQHVWTGVLERVQADEMPPEGAKQLEFGERQDLIEWSRRLQPKEVDCTKLASDRTVNFYTGNVMSRRLNRDEYERTVRDLVGIDVRPGRLLPADGAGGEGFDTTGDTLFTSSLTVEKYLEAAELITATILPDDPATLSPEIAAARTRLLGRLPSAEHPPRQAAHEVLARFLRRAFRRSVTPEEVAGFLRVFDHASARGDGYDAALRLALTGVLISPHFLFLVEPEPEQGDVQPLGPFPLASRLSYFLWASMPDEELLALAESGRLLDPAVYLAQIRRLLNDPRAASIGERFALQWLEIDKLGHEVKPDPQRYPEFARLVDAMRGEVVALVNEVFLRDRPLMELIDSDYVLVDRTMAAHYGMPVPAGDSFSRQPAPSRERGGITGVAAVHALTSYPLRTSPVLRGRWILEVLLGEKVPPPPPDVPALADDDHHLSAVDLREQLERHRRDPTCSSCHQRMDPLGFSLESFDNLGRHRTQADGRPIDVSAKLANGQVFDGPAGLKKILTERRDQVLRHLARKLTGYALGRQLSRHDDCVVRDSLAALAANGWRASVLVETIAQSKPFRYRYYAGKPAKAATQEVR
jgi:hypothetical protein